MPKRTFQPKKKRRQRKHGFQARMAKQSGQRIIKNRRRKGRKGLAV